MAKEETQELIQVFQKNKINSVAPHSNISNFNSFSLKNKCDWPDVA